MAMLDPTDQQEDRLAGRRALYVMGFLALMLVVFFVVIVAYYNSYGYHA